MKIIIDKMPETPRDCIFSESISTGGYVCTLRPYIEKIQNKPKCLCKDIKHCDRLKEIGE